MGVSLHRPDCPGICPVVQCGLELRKSEVLGLKGYITTHPERPEIRTMYLCSVSQEMSANGNSVLISTPGLSWGLMAHSLSLARREEAFTVSCSNCSNFPLGPVLDSYSEATKDMTFFLLSPPLTNLSVCLCGGC